MTLKQLLVDASDASRDTVLTRLSDRIGQHARALRRQRSAHRRKPRRRPCSGGPGPALGPQDMGNAAVTNSFDGIPERPGGFVEPTDELAA